jgi:hypothetical protein
MTQGFGIKPVCYENVSDYNYIHPGFIFIPCRGMTPDGLRAQYLIPNLSPSANAYPSIRPFRSGHVTTQFREISANSPFAERKQTADRKLLCRILLKKPSFFWTDFFTKMGPQIRLPSVPNFGVNRYQDRLLGGPLGLLTTRNQALANAYIWLQYGCFGCIWNQLHRSQVVDRWLQLERCNSLRQP